MLAGIVYLVFGEEAWAQVGQNKQIFSDLETVGKEASSGAITVVRSLGVAAVVVIGGFMVLTGRWQGRLIAGAVGGLLVAALSEPIVSFLFG